MTNQAFPHRLRVVRRVILVTTLSGAALILGMAPAAAQTVPTTSHRTTQVALQP